MSNYNIDAIPKRIDEEGIAYYAHKALRDAIEANGLVAKIELKTYLPGRVVAEATITDPSNGYEITEVGSVGVVESKIAKDFPVETAYSAAYDHAAVVILGLDTGEHPIWSNSHNLDNLEVPGDPGKLFIQDRAGIPSHRAIKRAARRNQRFTWSYKLLVCNQDAVIVECTVKDRAKGRTFTDVGSAIASNMRTGQEKSFPVELAYNRAFDRAAIAALYNTANLPEGVRGVWSNMEIIPQAPAAEEPAASETTSETAPAVMPDAETEIFSDKAQAAESPADEEVILFGICKGKTFAEIKGSEEEKKTIDWVMKSGITYPDEARQRQVARFKEMAKTA